MSHFRTPVETGLAILESLWGHTSGFAIPTFVVDAPKGGGKIPLLPNYKVSEGDGQVTLRNYQGRHFRYYEGKSADHMINRVCRICGTDHSSIHIGPAAEIWNSTPGPRGTPSSRIRNNDISNW